MVKIINVSINKKTRLGATYKERDIRTEEGTNHILKSPRLDAAKWKLPVGIHSILTVAARSEEFTQCSLQAGNPTCISEPDMRSAYMLVQQIQISTIFMFHNP